MAYMFNYVKLLLFKDLVIFNMHFQIRADIFVYSKTRISVSGIVINKHCLTENSIPSLLP